ncbi:zona pellucida sperm-binding protein 3-like [Menidia menidia]
MGFRVAAFFGFVLFLSCGNLCSAAQIHSVLITNETLHQVSQNQVKTSSEQTALNQTEQRHLVRSPVTSQLRTYHLRKPADRPKALLRVEGHKLQRAQARGLHPELKESTQAQEMLQSRAQDPHLPVEKESKVLVKVEQQVPVPAESVLARCGEKKVTIAVNQDFLGNGQLIRPSDLTVGGCAAVDTVDHVLMFQVELQNCSSTVMMTEEAIIYTFTLKYFPKPVGKTPILKTNPVEMNVRCHYQRRQYVSSDAMRPAWTTFASKQQADQRLHLSLRLMTEDWQSQRPSNVYFLSDVMHMEVSVLQGHHVPLRIFVDSCVATVNPDPSSRPRYPFINNYGCFNDSKMTGAKSYFLPQNQQDKLHFQLEAFKFYQDDRNALYISCHLKATKVDAPIDGQHKACSYLTEAKRWVASGGDNNVCRCCESSCSIRQRQRRSLAANAALQREGMAAPGPILLEDGIQNEGLTGTSEVPEAGR